MSTSFLKNFIKCGESKAVNWFNIFAKIMLHTKRLSSLLKYHAALDVIHL